MIWAAPILWVATALPAAACKVALILTVDVSGSIDHEEYRLQMDGLAAALEDSTVADALVDARAQVAIVQWSGASRQDVTVPWRRMRSLAAVSDLAQDVRQADRPWRHFSTAIGEMLAHVAPLFDQVQCAHKVVDVSGDGVSNEGRIPDEQRNALVMSGVRINALAILGASDEDLTAYFRKHVIGGLNAFVYEAKSYADYPETIRRKLLDEIAEPVS